MSSSRDSILGRIHAATTSLPEPAPMPGYDPAISVSRKGEAALAAESLPAAFAANWRATKGRWVDGWQQLVAFLKANAPGEGYCAPCFIGALKDAWPAAPVSDIFDRGRIDSYAFAITPAWGAIAETGTVILTDSTSPSRLAALAPWTHVAVVPESSIHPTLASAVAAFPDDPSIIMVTGPSKTADIEGILIEGVHGPGIQVAMPLPGA